MESFGDDEPVVVSVARDARAGLRPPSEVHAAFEQATVYAQRPERPGLLAADLPGQGRWTLVFSTPARLAAFAGDCACLSTTGADVLEMVPEGTGVLLDGEDDHWFPVLTRRADDEVIDRAWDAAGRERGGTASGPPASEHDDGPEGE